MGNISTIIIYLGIIPKPGRLCFQMGVFLKFQPSGSINGLVQSPTLLGDSSRLDG